MAAEDRASLVPRMFTECLPWASGGRSGEQGGHFAVLGGLSIKTGGHKVKHCVAQMCCGKASSRPDCTTEAHKAGLASVEAIAEVNAL
jgi:hypothetical protein